MPVTPLVNKIHTPSKVILLGLFAAALLAPLPYVLIAPSTPDDVLGKLISIDGVPTFQDRAKDKTIKSRLFITSVLVTNPNSYINLLAVIDLLTSLLLSPASNLLPSFFLLDSVLLHHHSVSLAHSQRC